MQITQVLLEKVVNLFDQDQKDKYGQQVWDILLQSYAPIGGFQTASSLEELMHKSGLWKLVMRDGQITAVKIYRDQFGRKAVAMGTDGSIQGRRDIRMLIADDVKFGRSWAETSGAPERIMKGMGAPPIPAIYAEFLSNKAVLSYNPDGFHYTRLIEGEPHEKIMYGTLKLTKAEQEALSGIGVHFTNWPTAL